MSQNNESKNVDTLGYSPQEYSKFNKNSWMVLIIFSVLYAALYFGRANFSAIMPAMEEQEGWNHEQLGLATAVLFWTYGLGHLVNGRLGEIFGLKRFIVIGLFLSMAMNFLVSFQASITVIIILWALNGYFQSMLWSPGIALLSKWWPGAKRGFATGFANAFSSLGSALAPIMVTVAYALMSGIGWRAGFRLPIVIPIIVCFIFIILIKVSPSKIGLKEYVDSDAEKNKQDEELTRLVQEKGKLYPYIHLFRQWRFDLWLLIVAGSNIARWGLITWIPTYYKDQFGVSLKEGLFDIVMLPLGMALGTLIIPWITDKFFSRNRLPMVILCGAVSGVMVFLFTLVEPGLTAQVLLFIAGFFIYAINGIVWAYSTDVGGRAFSGTAAGVLDCAAYLGASIQALFIPKIVESTGSFTMGFVTLAAICGGIVVCSLIAGKGLSNKGSKLG